MNYIESNAGTKDEHWQKKNEANKDAPRARRQKEYMSVYELLARTANFFTLLIHEKYI